MVKTTFKHPRKQFNLFYIMASDLYLNIWSRWKTELQRVRVNQCQFCVKFIPYRTQIRPKTRRFFFFLVTVISQALQSDTYLHFSGRQYSSPTPHLPFYLILLFGVSFSETWKSKLRKKFGKSGSVLKKQTFQRCP